MSNLRQTSPWSTIALIFHSSLAFAISVCRVAMSSDSMSSVRQLPVTLLISASATLLVAFFLLECQSYPYWSLSSNGARKGQLWPRSSSHALSPPVSILNQYIDPHRAFSSSVTRFFPPGGNESSWKNAFPRLGRGTRTVATRMCLTLFQ